MRGRGSVVLVCPECGDAFRCGAQQARRGRRFCCMACAIAYRNRHGRADLAGKTNDRTALLRLEKGPIRWDCRVSWCYRNTLRGCEIGGCRKKVAVV